MGSQPLQSLPAVLLVSDLQRELRCGVFLARRIAREIGRRAGARRYVVHRDALEAYLRERGDAPAAAPSTPTDDPQSPPGSQA